MPWTTRGYVNPPSSKTCETSKAGDNLFIKNIQSRGDHEMKHSGWLIFFSLWFGSHAFAESDTTLKQAIRYTVQENFTLRAATQNISTAEAEIRVAESARKPSLNFRYGFQLSDNPLDRFAEKLNTRSVRTRDFEPDALNDHDVSSLFDGTVALQYSVYNGGRTEADIERAAHNSDQARLQHKRITQRLVFNTIYAYYNTQAATRGVEIAQQAEAAGRRHTRTTRKLVREDRTVQSDQLTAEVNWSALKSLSAQSKARLKSAYNKLKVAMGAPQTRLISVTPLSLDSVGMLMPDVEIYEANALTSRFDLQAMQAVLETANAEVRSAEAQLRPRVDLLVDTSLYEDHPFVNEYSWRVMGVVSKDLYTGGRTQSTVDTARSRAAAIRHQIASLRQAILGEVREAYDRINESVDRLKVAKGNVDNARRNVRLISERYGQGRTILIDLLGAEQRLVEARTEELAAKRALLINIAALSLADGALDPDISVSYQDVAR